MDARSSGEPAREGRLVDPTELSTIRRLVEADLPEYLSHLERLVETDCGSYTKSGVDDVGRWMAQAFGLLGAEVSIEANEQLGDTVVGEIRGSPGGPTVLLIGHMDTVFDPGTVAQRPFRIKGGIAYGPGVTDMKSGLLAGIYALKALRSLQPYGDGLPFGRIVYVANPDEEIGSPVSTPVIRRYAAEADLALVLECARANGDIVSSRKGICDLELVVRGRAAHAGVEPEKGRNAVLEAAHKTVAIQALNGRWPEVTLNVGVMHGGTRPNVVAEEAVLQVDVRAVTRLDLEEAEAAVRAIAVSATVADTSCEVSVMGRHWPMEKLERSERLVELAVSLADELGFDLHDTATGGASDANTTAGMGVPTLDGLGPIGGLDHSPGEYLEVASIVPRVTLLAALLLAAARDPIVATWHAERRTRGYGG